MESTSVNDHDLALRIANAIVGKLAGQEVLRGRSLHLFLDEESSSSSSSDNGGGATRLVDLVCSYFVRHVLEMRWCRSQNIRLVSFEIETSFLRNRVRPIDVTLLTVCKGTIELADFVPNVSSSTGQAVDSAPISGHARDDHQHELDTSTNTTTTPDPSQPELQQPQRRSTRPRHQLSRSTSEVDSEPASKQRRTKTAGLRLGAPSTDQEDENHVRRLQSDISRVPQRKPETASGQPKLLPASLDNFVLSIWQQIYSSMSFDINAVVRSWSMISPCIKTS